MMNYEVFKEEVKNKFREYLPEQYRERELKVTKITKVNRTLEGIYLAAEVDGKCVSPTVYIEDMYENYKRCGDFQEVLQGVADAMVEAFSVGVQDMELDFSDVSGNIVFQLVNTEQNKEMLERMPHREFQDLSVIYRCVVAMDERGVQSALFDSRLADLSGLTEEQLFNLAMENTRRLLPPRVRTMEEVLLEALGKDAVLSGEIQETLEMGASVGMKMYVISNERAIMGAASILYEDVLQELSGKLGGSFYVLPSSVHEMIAVPESAGILKFLAEMVPEVNMNSVVLAERLSNQVYRYDKDSGKLSIATDMSNKRLDGIME